MQRCKLHLVITLVALIVEKKEAVTGKFAFEVDSSAVVKQSNTIQASTHGATPTYSSDQATSDFWASQEVHDDVQTVRAAEPDPMRESMIRRNYQQPEGRAAALVERSVLEMIGELFIVSGEFDGATRSFSKHKNDSQLVGGLFMSLGSIIILACAAAMILHFNPGIMGNGPSRGAAQNNAPSSRVLCSMSATPMEKAVECDKTGGIVAVVGSKESSLFNGTLFKLDEDAYDEPHDPERWRARDVWIGNQGVMYYFSKKEDRPVALYDMKSVGSLIVKKQSPAASAQKFCVSIGIPPSSKPEEDPDPTLWAAQDQKSLAAFLDACQHFQAIEKDRTDAWFSCTLQKLDSLHTEKIEGQFDADNWKEYVIWINAQGVICYYSIKDKNIAAFCNGVGVGYLEVERLADGLTCEPFSLSVKNLNDSVISPGGKLKRKSAGQQPITLFAFADERTLSGFIMSCEKFQDEMLETSPSLRNHGIHSMKNAAGSASNVSVLLDRQGTDLDGL